MYGYTRLGRCHIHVFKFERPERERAISSPSTHHTSTRKHQTLPSSLSVGGFGRPYPTVLLTPAAARLQPNPTTTRDGCHKKRGLLRSAAQRYTGPWEAVSYTNLIASRDVGPWLCGRFWHEATMRARRMEGGGGGFCVRETEAEDLSPWSGQASHHALWSCSYGVER